MRKTIVILGSVLLVLTVLLSVGYGSLALLGKRLDKESKAYVDSAVPAIVTGWDLDELRKRTSPEFDDGADYDELQDYFDELRQLGNLTEYKGAEGDANITLSLLYGIEVSADYAAFADFETGSADIRISLIKRDGLWQILDLSITPQPFAERQDII